MLKRTFYKRISHKCLFRKRLLQQLAAVVAGIVLLSTSRVTLAYEVEPLDAIRLITACESVKASDQAADRKNNDSELDSVLCKSYLQGYFAATDEVVAIERIPSALTIRAMKTRGARLPEVQKKTFNAAYCISESETLEDIARKVSRIDKNSATDKTAKALLKEFLSEHFDCKKLKHSSE